MRSRSLESRGIAWFVCRRPHRCHSPSLRIVEALGPTHNINPWILLCLHHSLLDFWSGFGALSSGSSGHSKGEILERSFAVDKRPHLDSVQWWALTYFPSVVRFFVCLWVLRWRLLGTIQHARPHFGVVSRSRASRFYHLRSRKPRADYTATGETYPVSWNEDRS